MNECKQNNFFPYQNKHYTNTTEYAHMAWTHRICMHATQNRYGKMYGVCTHHFYVVESRILIPIISESTQIFNFQLRI